MREAENKLDYYRNLVEKSGSSEAKNAMAANLAIEYEKRLAEKELEVKKLQRSLAEVSETKMQVAGLLEENQRLKEQLERSQAQSKKGKEPGNLKGKVEELEDENTTMIKETKKKCKT